MKKRAQDAEYKKEGALARLKNLHDGQLSD